MLEVARRNIPLAAGSQFLLFELIQSPIVNSPIAVSSVAFLLQISLSEFQSVSLEFGKENLKGSVLCPLTQKRQKEGITYFNSRVAQRQFIDLALA
jgi:hypothetical protein